MAVLRDLPSEAQVRTHATQMMRALADVWVDHPSYPAQWRDAVPQQEAPPDDLVLAELLDPV